MADFAATAPKIEPTEKKPKTWEYVGPTPAPLISNLPIDLGDPSLGMSGTKYHADELPQEYIPYVMKTSTTAKDWWK